MSKEVVKAGKDLTQKFLSNVFRGNFLSHFGLGQVEVVEAISTDLPVVQIREKRLDIIFRAQDGSNLHLEFQSTVPRNLRGFLVYDALLYQRDGRRIRTVVFYSNGITSAEAEIDVGAILYRVENVFFADYDGDARLECLVAKDGGMPFNGDEQLDLIFLAHMRSKLPPGERVLEAVRLAETITGERERTNCVGAIIGMGYEFLTEEQKARIREVAKGMGVPMDDFLEDLRQDYIREGLAQGMAQGLAQGKQLGTKNDILLLLENRFGQVPISVREDLAKEQSDDRLARLLLAAANPTTLEEFAALVSGGSGAKGH